MFFSLELWRKGVSDIVIECLPCRNDLWAWVVNLPCCIAHLKALIYVYVCKGSAEGIFAQKHLAVIVFFYFPPDLFDWLWFYLCLLLFVFEITSWGSSECVSCQRSFSSWRFWREQGIWSFSVIWKTSLTSIETRREGMEEHFSFFNTDLSSCFLNYEQLWPCEL